MASENPVSPKLVAGGLWSVIVPSVVALVLAAIDYLTNNGPSLFPTIPTWLWPLLSTLGFAVGGYLRKDPARVTTVEEAEDKLAVLVAAQDEVA